MTKTLILRRRVELRGRGVSRECRRPAQASVQAAVPCKPESAHRVERRAQARAGQLPPVSVHSVYCPQRLQHLPRLTYLAIVEGLKRTASVMPFKAFLCQLNLLYLPLGERAIIVRWLRRYFDQVAGKDIHKAIGQYSMLTMARMVTKQIVRSWGTKCQE